jgi:pimeloyl-ACP methyl ester carboxylesterase
MRSATPTRLLQFVLLPLMLAACSTLETRTRLLPRSSYALGEGGVRLHYLDFGGRGEPVLLLPGAGNTPWIFSGLGADLARDYRVLALSRRGHGESDMPASGYDQATLTRDIRLFLDQQGLAKIHLIGHSAAGEEMTRFAGDHPDRVASIVYLDAAYDRSTQGPVQSGSPDRPAAPTEADRASIDSFVKYLFATRPDYALFPRSIVEEDTRKSLAVRPDGSVGFRMGEAQFAEYLASLSTAAPDYRRVRAPALAIYAGGQSKHRLLNARTPEQRAAIEQHVRLKVEPWRDASVAQFRSGMARGEVLILDAVHHLFLHKPVETAGAIRDFLKRNPLRR